VGATVNPSATGYQSLHTQGTATGDIASTIPAATSFAGTASVPLTHPQSFTHQPTALGVEAMATGSASHMTGHMTQDLVNLTGEDLQILDFVNQL
jgi:hypothetical protein